jgi:hypothetical protein
MGEVDCAAPDVGPGGRAIGTRHMSPERVLVAEDAAQRARHRDRVAGLTVVSVAFFIALAISWWAKLKSQPDSLAPPGPPTTVGIVGYPSAIDPIQVLGVARGLTRRTQLRGIAVEGVKSDGTVDVSNGTSQVRYSFRSLPGEGPQPSRDRHELRHSPYCGEQTLRLGRDGLVAEPDRGDARCNPIFADALPDPHCGPRDVWRHALTRAPGTAGLARIEYYRADAGPAWRFAGNGQSFSLYGDCARELGAAEGQDSAR